MADDGASRAGEGASRGAHVGASEAVGQGDPKRSGTPDPAGSLGTRVLAALERLSRFLGLWPSGLALGLLLVWLPWTGGQTSLGGGTVNGITRGLFQDLTFWDSFFASFALVTALGSLVFAFALLVKHAAQLGAQVQGQAPLPRWAARVFALPFGPRAAGLVVVLTVPFAVTTARTAATGHALTGLLAVALGAVAAGVVGTLAAAVTRLAALEDEPVPSEGLLAAILFRNRNPPSGGARRPPMGGAAVRLRGAALWARRRFSALLPRSDLALVETPAGRAAQLGPLVDLDHFTAACSTALVGSVLVGMGLAFHPTRGVAVLPSAALLFVVITQVTWIVGALRFHLARWHVSPMLVFGLLMALLFQVGEQDHEYSVTARGESPSARLSPLEVVCPSQSGRCAAGTTQDGAAGERAEGTNLVVVTTTGGGIWASVWTTWALQRLFAERPSLSRELRVISGVSGGAVGTAFYVAARLACPECSALEASRRAFEAARAPSLDAVSYGLAYRDSFRFVGRLFGEDRGTLLEDYWCQRASHASGEGREASCRRVTLAQVAEGVRAGLTPLPILNATVMESGRRVMLTPLRFEAAPVDGLPGGADRRGWTLDEYLLGKGRRAGMSLWTAARLSATFPFITPAARAPLALDPASDLAAGGTCPPGDQGAPGEGPACRVGHHLLDGGYYDNYGVASALDWLRPVLDHQLSTGRPNLRRVLILQLRSQRELPPRHRPGESASVSAFLGPLLGVMNIRAGAARQRNDIALSHFISHYNEAFATQCEAHGRPQDDALKLATVVMQPPPRGLGGASEPLNWRLTREDVRRLTQDLWPASREAWPPNLDNAFGRAHAFLGPEPNDHSDP